MPFHEDSEPSLIVTPAKRTATATAFNQTACTMFAMAPMVTRGPGQYQDATAGRLRHCGSGAAAPGMRNVNRFPCAALLALGWWWMTVPVFAAHVPAAWPLRDLGPFSLRAPAGMALTRAGSDSLAEQLADGALRLDYDFGLFADLLQARAKAKDFQVQAIRRSDWTAFPRARCATP